MKNYWKRRMKTNVRKNCSTLRELLSEEWKKHWKKNKNKWRKNCSKLPELLSKEWKKMKKRRIENKCRKNCSKLRELRSEEWKITQKWAKLKMNYAQKVSCQFMHITKRVPKNIQPGVRNIGKLREFVKRRERLLKNERKENAQKISGQFTHII